MLAYADGADSARTPPGEVARLAGIDDGALVLGWMPEDRAWLADPAVHGSSIMAGYALAPAIAAGRIAYLPVRLSTVPGLVAGRLRPEVTVVTGVRRGADLVFAGSVGWGPAAARAADRVVVEVVGGDADVGGPPIPGRIVATVDRPGAAIAPGVARAPLDVDLAIGRLVASVLPDDPTLQLGPGGIADAVVRCVERPVRIWSGLVTDAVVELAQRGLVTGEVVAGYVWGPAVSQGALAGGLRLVPVEESHDLGRVAAIERFIGCNTALQVGLDGSVNVERVGGRLVAGIGGHADFCAAATRSCGGLSIVALRSTTKRGASTIVPRVEVVSTPRCDVEIVITEHGIADLRGVGDHERAHRLTMIAAPQHRDALATARPEARG